ncbi:hypothetical protein Bbelb_241710 [Branchiostoma belcheri]|nr:hypothetical protein Bbelb_241710 [Branchiostoma belcheri]
MTTETGPIATPIPIKQKDLPESVHKPGLDITAEQVQKRGTGNTVRRYHGRDAALVTVEVVVQSTALISDITNLLIVDHNVGTMSSGDTSALSDLPCGTYCRVWLVNCNITTIEAGAFAKLPQVETLVIWRSNLQTLKSGAFEGMGGLKHLLLLGNNITCLETGTFDGMPELGYLYLVENQILTMPAGVLHGLQSEWLDVSMNSISHIAPGVLQDAGPVRHIYAIKNRLQSVSVGMFAGLEQLRLLYLQDNEISSIADGAFVSNKLLRTIGLSGNKLTFLSGLWFVPGKSYPHVNVKGNAIAAVAHASRLTTFFLPNNPLRWTLPVAVNASALPCPAPFVEIVNAQRNQHPQAYTASGNVYWEDLPRVSWTFANSCHIDGAHKDSVEVFHRGSPGSQAKCSAKPCPGAQRRLGTLAFSYGDTVANAGPLDDQITPYAITYDVEDDDITPYAEGHLRDHDSLCESDDSDSSEIVPYGVSKICDKYVSGDGKKTQENTPVTYRKDNLSSEGPVSKTYGKDEPKETILNDSVNVTIHQPSPSPLSASYRSEAACSTASPLPEAVAVNTEATPVDTKTTDVSVEDN